MTILSASIGGSPMRGSNQRSIVESAAYDGGEIRVTRHRNSHPAKQNPQKTMTNNSKPDFLLVEAPLSVRASKERRLPLSFAQQRLWFLDQLAPNNPFYNIPASVRLEGRLNLGILERVINEIVRRHQTLRTRIKVE